MTRIVAYVQYNSKEQAWVGRIGGKIVTWGRNEASVFQLLINAVAEEKAAGKTIFWARFCFHSRPMCLVQVVQLPYCFAVPKELLSAVVTWLCTNVVDPRLVHHHKLDYGHIFTFDRAEDAAKFKLFHHND